MEQKGMFELEPKVMQLPEPLTEISWCIQVAAQNMLLEKVVSCY